jgi:DNA modification methylase
MEFYKHKVAKVEDLIPYALNSRTHSDEQVAQLAASIREFGFTNPVLVDEANNLIAGHGRLLAARKLKMEKVPAIVVDGLDDRKRRALVIADNKLALNAGWDEDALRVELEDLAGDFGELMGFSQDELVALLKQEEGTEGLTDEDAVPEAPEQPVTVEGDVWLLGRHRLMCGDSTSIDAVEKLMDGRKSNMVFTDPPYLMDFTGAINNDGSKSHSSVHGAIKNDKMSREDGDKFIGDIVSNIKIFNDGAYYICFYRLGMDYVLRALDINKLKYRAMIVWYKKGGTLSNSDYKSNYEPIFYGWVNEHKFYGGKSEWDFWDISKTSKNDLHPTMKPVELCERAIKNSSQINGIVLDLFGGSGSTLIACEKTNRDCRMMELDQKYCDVIIKRWQDFTGEKAIHEASGKAYDDMKPQNEAA